VAAVVAGGRRRARPAPARRASRVATTVLMAVMLAVAGLTVVGRVAGVRTLVEHSGSMEPAIAPGALILSRAVRADTVAVGEIISFRDADRGGALITHRVTEVRRIGDTMVFSTQGDANTGGERWTSPPGAELGRTVAVLPFAGLVVATLARPLVAACLAAMIAVLLALIVAGRWSRRRL
jgi:signal peptidase I